MRLRYSVDEMERYRVQTHRVIDRIVGICENTFFLRKKYQMGR